jgi:hypothetical protein
MSPANSRSSSVNVAINWFEVTNVVRKAVPFQKTIASGPKLVPSTVIVKGTLLTGTLAGDSSAIEGAVGNTLIGLCPDIIDPEPHPRLNNIASKKHVYRIASSCDA